MSLWFISASTQSIVAPGSVMSGSLAAYKGWSDVDFNGQTFPWSCVAAADSKDEIVSVSVEKRKKLLDQLLIEMNRYSSALLWQPWRSSSSAGCECCLMEVQCTTKQNIAKEGLLRFYS